MATDDSSNEILEGGGGERAGRIQIGGEGAGAPAQGELANRALEIAEIEGRPGRPTPADYDQAREELDIAPEREVDPHELMPNEGPEARDTAQSQGGRVVHRENAEPEDEADAPEQLVNEGVEEAEHEQMLEARRRDEDER